MAAFLPMAPMPRDSYLYYGDVTVTVGVTVTSGTVSAQTAASRFVAVGPAAPLEVTRFSKKEMRRLWTRRALVAHAAESRRYPPLVIERPRALPRFKRTTRSQASRWRVLQ